MKISDFLREKRILLNLEASNKEEAIKELGELLRDADEISDFDLFLKHVFERENLNTTGIGNNVAIPHARTDTVKKFVVAFGRSPQGIEFNSVDNKPAKFIFLMGTPMAKGLNKYLKILAYLTRLLNKKAFQEGLLKASSPQEIIENFKIIEH